MDEPRKRAYRSLLYWAMLEIQPIEWGSPRWIQRVNPFHWIERSSHLKSAGAVADWLHNLANYSACEFEGFDEDWFWKEHAEMQDRLRGSWFNYRALFERSLQENCVANIASASITSG